MSGSSGGPSDDKDAKIRDLEAQLAAARGGAVVSQPGPSGAKARRKEREALVRRIFGKFGRR